jgi:hypothetical protein
VNGCDDTCHAKPCWTCPGGACEEADAGTDCHVTLDGGTGVVCDGSGKCLPCLPLGTECDATGSDGTGGCRFCHGQSCSSANGATYCASGICVDGVCCNEACDGTCRACNLAGSEGICDPILYMHTDNEPSCTGTSACDGQGACAIASGQVRYNGGKCVSGKYRLRCSNNSLKSCNADAECGASASCLEYCLTDNGGFCSGNAECISGNCNKMHLCQQ